MLDVGPEGIEVAIGANELRKEVANHGISHELPAQVHVDTVSREPPVAVSIRMPSIMTTCSMTVLDFLMDMPQEDDAALARPAA